MIEYKLSLASSGAVKAPGYEDMLRFGYNKNCGVYRPVSYTHLDVYKRQVLGRRAVAGGVVGEAEVIIDGLGYTDKTHRTAYLCAVAAELGDGVHRVVAADVEHRADVVLVKQGEQLDVGRGVRLRLGELVAAAAQIAGRCALCLLYTSPCRGCGWPRARR